MRCMRTFESSSPSGHEDYVEDRINRHMNEMDSKGYVLRHVEHLTVGVYFYWQKPPVEVL